MSRVEVFGLLGAESYHIARCCAEDLYQKYPEKFGEPTIKPMLECEWDHFVDKKKLEIRGDTWAYSEKVMCFLNDAHIGGHKELLQWALEEYCYEDFRPESLYSAMAEEAYADYFMNSEHKFGYFDISINGIKEGRLLFELLADICPKTCENFLSLCTGSKGTLPSGLTLDYKNTVIHRIVPNGWLQGGDILHGRGDAGESIFGTVFEDENFAISHSRRGILGMANKGRHTNASQFYVTFQPTKWMDCTYVAFGNLIEGTELLSKLENLSTYNERPKLDCRIMSCGEYNPNCEQEE